MNNDAEGCQSFEEWLIKLAPKLLFGKPPVPNGTVPEGLEPTGKQEDEEVKDIQESTWEASRLFEQLSRRQALA
jgi:hypothetical protein